MTLFSPRYAGAALGLAAIASGASAQVACPPGYGYSYGYGCVAAAPVYAAPVVIAPPVYDAFGLGFGFGHGHPHGWHGGPPGHGDHWHH
jgi:hypothetical protein